MPGTTARPAWYRMQPNRRGSIRRQRRVELRATPAALTQGVEGKWKAARSAQLRPCQLLERLKRRRGAAQREGKGEWDGGAARTREMTRPPYGTWECAQRQNQARVLFPGPNDIEFSGEKEGAQRLTPSPLQ